MATKNIRKRHWSMLAYIAGDNDLSNEGLSDITEMCKEGSSPNMHVGVQIDTEGELDGLIRYEITEPGFDGKSYRKVIERLPEKDSGSGACLTDFLTYALKRYPSEKKIGIVWSHGSGFKAVARDISFDYSTGNSMDMPEIVLALKKAGINAKNKLDIIGFDACLMAMLEVAHHLKDNAKILVGSQQTEPGNGWPYDKILKHMKHNPEPQKLAFHIVNEYTAFYRKKRTKDVTQSAIDLSKTQNAVNALHEFGRYLKTHMATKTNDGEFKIKTLLGHCRVACQNFDYTDYIDVIDFVKHFKKGLQNKYPELLVLCDKLSGACGKCIMHGDSYGNGVNRSNGLSIWFPGSREMYYLNRAKYMKLSCNAKDAGWVKFLDEYYNG